MTTRSRNLELATASRPSFLKLPAASLHPSPFLCFFRCGACLAGGAAATRLGAATCATAFAAALWGAFALAAGLAAALAAAGFGAAALFAAAPLATGLPGAGFAAAAFGTPALLEEAPFLAAVHTVRGKVVHSVLPSPPAAAGGALDNTLILHSNRLAFFPFHQRVWPPRL